MAVPTLNHYLMKKTLLVSLFAWVAISCGASAVKTTSIKANSVENLGKKLNTLYDVEIGENMTETEYGSYFDAIRITKGAQTNKYYFDGKINSGELYVKFKESKDYHIYTCPQDNCKIGVAVSKKDGNTKLYYESGYSKAIIDLKEQLEYDKTTYLSVQDSFFKREFVYNGKVGNSLKFMYREYKNDMARPAFTQDLQYDLSESSIIGFKGLRIEVIKATNTNIQYKVLSEFTH